MKGIVIYKSVYGATKEYAEWIAADLGFPISPAGSFDSKDIPGYDIFVCAGSVYVGKLNIAPWIRKNWKALSGKPVYLFTVAGVTPDDKETLAAIINNNFSPEIRNRLHHFHGSGRMKLSSLGIFHRLLIKMRFSFEKDEKVREIAAKGYDNMKRTYIQPLVSAVKSSPEYKNKKG